MKKYIPYLIIFLLLSIVVWQCQDKRNNKIDQITDKLDAVKKPLEKKIANLEKNLKRLKKDSISISDSLVLTNLQYKKLLSSTQKLTLADSLQKEEIRKGEMTFGKAPVFQYQPVLASSYGNQAFDNLFFTRDLLLNQTKVSTTYKGIVKAQDTIIAAQDIAVKKLAKVSKKSFWKKLWGWIQIAGIAAFGFFLGGL